MNADLETRVQRFLQGRMSPEEQGRFVAEVGSDPQARELLDRESALDALLSKDPWPNAHGTDEALARALAPEDEVAALARAKTPGREMFSDAEWKGMVDRALETTDLQESAPRREATIYQFPSPFFYAIAAGLLLFVGAGFYLRTRQHGAPPAVSHVTPAPPPMAETPAPQREPVDNLAFIATGRPSTSVVKKTRAARSDSVHTQPNQQAVVRLSQKTGVLVEPETRIAVEYADSRTAAVRLDEGSAVFSVEKNRYDRFTVATPLANITVTGTAFSTTADGKNVLVHVIDGTILLEQLRAATTAIELAKGSSMLITPDSIIPVVLEALRILDQKESMLRSLLGDMLADTVAGPAAPPSDARGDYQQIRGALLYGKGDPVSKVNAFLREHPNDAHNDDLLLELARFYESINSWENARNTYSRIVRSKTNTRPYQTALYKSSVIYMEQLSDLTAADSGFTEYLREYPDGDWAEEAYTHLVKVKLLKNKQADARVLMARFLEQFPTSISAPEIAYQCGHSNRLSGNTKDALKWYVKVVDGYQKSTYREASLYWAGWCLKQQGVRKADNPYFRTYEEQYPDGEWMEAISSSN